MEVFSQSLFIATLALIGVIIIVSSLMSGIIERSGLPQVAIFLMLGAVLGPAGLALLNPTLDSPELRVVATLGLALVLFNDAISLDLGEVRRHGRLAALMLGPGTLLSALLIAAAAWLILGVPPAAAAILGAALASTDPVLLRGLLRHPRIPDNARLALRLESGMNDAVLLPIVIIAMVFLSQSTDYEAAIDWARLVINLLVLGPFAGVAVGLVAIATLDMVRRRIGIRRDYESIYSLGVAFSAFAAAEALGGSGFLAAFAAGLTISALDVELCECFVEYGETTAEMTLLFTFVLFGTSLIWQGFGVLDWRLIVFTLMVLLARPAAFLLSLARTDLSWRTRNLIAWFGPRGLSSMLLVLLPVFATIDGSVALFNSASFVVLVSVLVYSFVPMFLNRNQTAGEAEFTPPVTVPTLPPVNGGPTTPITDIIEHRPVPRITLSEVQQLQKAGHPVLLVDARSERSYKTGKPQARNAIWLPPDHAVAQAIKLDLPREATLVVYCGCPDEATSLRVVEDLRQAGWPHSYALEGGITGWEEAHLPTEIIER